MPVPTERPPRAARPLIRPERRAAYRNRLIESRLTPNAISLTGAALNLLAAVLVTQDLWVLAGLSFVVGSVMDTLDGRYSRMSGKGTPFGAFLDSTLDRLEEGVVLAAVASHFAEEGRSLAVVAVVLAVLASLMVSYTRARAEALGVECKVGVATRPVRVVIIATGLLFEGLGLLDISMYVLAALSLFTVGQRIVHVRKALNAPPPRPPPRRNASAPMGYTPSLTLPSTRGLRTDVTPTNGNGAGPQRDGQVRVAILGVGNCASAFVQGVHFYRDADPAQAVPGLMHVDLGGYHVRDIEFTAAFDIDADKVGKDLGEAIWAGQNNTLKFADVPAKVGVEVHRGMTHDGLGKYLSQKIDKAPGQTADIAQILQDTQTDVVVSYLPVGSEQATKWYVEQVLEAGCGFVNCIPVFIAREDYWNKRFEKAGVPIVGDDIKSQVGATIVHRTLARLFGDRGVKMLRTSQLNVGGNMDFYNMLERERLESKKISKTNAVTSILDHELPADDVYIGPSDYVPWLTDRKWAHIRVEGQAFGDVPLNLEMKLEVWDSPNSAGIVIDAVRCCKLALDHGVGGQLDGPSSYLMKSPMHQRPDHLAREATERFIAEHAPDAQTAQAAQRAAEQAAKSPSAVEH